MSGKKKWFEIPTNHFNNTKNFYEELFSLRLQEQELFGTVFGIFSSAIESKDTVTRGTLIKGEVYDPKTSRTLLYFKCKFNLDKTLKKAVEFGGSVTKEKTELGNKLGFIAEITDPEGNRIGLHSDD